MKNVVECAANLALGALGGLAGTMAIQSMLTASQKWLPAATPPLRDDPGHFMVKSAERAFPRNVRRQIPTAVEKGVGQTLAIGYGLTFGALYAALRPRNRAPSPAVAVIDGAALGAVTWATGDLGWLPATGLTPPVWEQKPAQVVGPLLEHVVYGVVTVAAYDYLRDHV